MYQIGDFYGTLGTVFNCVVGEVCEEGSAIFPESEPESGLYFALFMVKLDFIIEFDEELGFKPLHDINELFEKLLFFNEELTF